MFNNLQARNVWRICVAALFTAAMSSGACTPAAGPTPVPTGTPAPTGDGDTTRDDTDDGDRAARRVQPSDLVYRGAFRLPDRAPDDPDAESWEYAGRALTYRVDGDPGGEADGYPGSLFGTGHDILNYVSEVSIPAPSLSRDLTELETATTLSGFHDIRDGMFAAYAEIPRVGMEYVPAQTGHETARLHLAWGQHFHEDTVEPTHAWCDVDLANPNTVGAWWIADESLYSVNGYILTIPRTWADEHTGGLMLATGRYRDGGWSGRGPSLFAYAPWLDGDPPAAGEHLTARTLLLYSHTRGDATTDTALEGYQDSDEWEDGAWLTTDDGRSAVVFAGNKGSGYVWYGFFSPQGDGMPCVEQNLTFIGCHDADGVECPEAMQGFCEGNNPASRGWWSSRFDAQILFYDTQDLADVAAGRMEPGEPQPYAVLDIDEHLLLDGSVEPIMLGTGDQRKLRVSEMAYDAQRGILFLLELFADEAKPVVHVWSVT